ncbi:hypothetical protein, partial [Providencia stuartii]|uniref:hypothetical protein n=1 Tax=Providencia stuartii TaxID=588 RepID=UPI001952E878
RVPSSIALAMGSGSVTNAAMLTCCTLELTMGLSGYLAYQTNTVGNVLNDMNAYHWSGLLE